MLGRQFQAIFAIEFREVGLVQDCASIRYKNLWPDALATSMHYLSGNKKEYKVHFILNAMYLIFTVIQCICFGVKKTLHLKWERPLAPMFCLALANSRLEPNSPEAVGRGTRIHVHCTLRLLRASMHRVGDSLRPVKVVDYILTVLVMEMSTYIYIYLS